MKTKIWPLAVLLIALAIVAGCKKDDPAPEEKAIPTPPYAASAQTWTFGTSTLTWSDAIHIPDCNKESFEDSYDEPQCRSYTYEGKTYYYYNWPYVDTNKSALCPDPWRVPTKDDFAALVETLGGDTQVARDALSTAWGYGGRSNASSMDNETTYGSHRSSEESRNGRSRAYRLYNNSGNLFVSNYYKYDGSIVWCVR
jgi:uncharacterized protein (TIGR02145 family)